MGGGLLLLSPILITGLFLLGRRSISEEKQSTYLRLLIYTAWIVTAFAWLVDLMGTYVSYQSYRIQPPQGVTDLHKFPRSYLLSKPQLGVWENIGMKWKEYLGWVAPLLSTPAAYILSVYGKSLEEMSKLRTAVMTLMIVVFITAAITGFIGILVTKLAPVR